MSSRSNRLPTPPAPLAHGRRGAVSSHDAELGGTSSSEVVPVSSEAASVASEAAPNAPEAATVAPEAAPVGRDALIASALAPATTSPDTICPICRSSFPPGENQDDPAVSLPCNTAHIFCRSCITTWLSIPRRNTCPICRGAAFPEPDSASHNAIQTLRQYLADLQRDIEQTRANLRAAVATLNFTLARYQFDGGARHDTTPNTPPPSAESVSPRTTPPAAVDLDAEWTPTEMMNEMVTVDAWRMASTAIPDLARLAAQNSGNPSVDEVRAAVQGMRMRAQQLHGGAMTLGALFSALVAAADEEIQATATQRRESEAGQATARVWNAFRGAFDFGDESDDMALVPRRAVDVLARRMVNSSRQHT